MPGSLMITLQQGVQYSKVWPLVSELNSVFPENQVIRMTKFGQQVMPALSILSVVVQLQWLGQTYLGQALASALFLLSLPLQGWYWLGIRAATPLPPTVAAWYQQIRRKMQQQGIELASLKSPNCYRDLAQLLSKAYQQLDKAFVREWL